MLEPKKEETKKLKQEIIKQEEVNKELRNIHTQLNKIPNISFDYMAALIYILYECKQYNFDLKVQNLRDIEEIDYYLEKIRRKENDRELFLNIKFVEVINRVDFVTFQEVIIALKKLIEKLQQVEKKGKSMLAEAFEYVMINAAQNNEIRLNNGEFYTPKEVVKTMVRALDVQDNMGIYDPACGTGSFLVESAKYNKIYAFGEELDRNTYNICMTNLWLHDVENKKMKEDIKEILPEVDIVLTNPPFASDTKIEGRLREVYDKYHIPFSVSTYTAYLIMMLNRLKENGKMAIILPHGFLFKKTEQRIRAELIKNNLIDAIIGLPENLFYQTRIPVIVLLIDKAKRKEEILFIDASREYVSERKNNILTEQNQDKIISTYRQYKEIENYSHIADVKEIEENDYNLSIKKYVKMHKKIETIEQEKTEKLIDALEKERREIQIEMEEIIRKIQIKR